jgi:DNA-binding transcriptional MerR regulator
MNDIPTSDSLLWEALPDLTLNIAQTAALCGISVRQLGYWTRQGYVAAQGQGARRTYGLEAVRRVLAIRKAMDGGASLRQALRLVSSLEAPASPAPLSSQPASAGPSAPPALSSEESHALARCLRAFFERNRYVRDHAGGLAVKIGRAEDDVRAVAESLCAAGVLVKEICQGIAIFHQAKQEASHA